MRQRRDENSASLRNGPAISRDLKLETLPPEEPEDSKNATQTRRQVDTMTLSNSDLLFTQLPSKTVKCSDRLIINIKQTEKRVFPTNEAFDFEAELKKRNTSLFCVYREVTNIASPEIEKTGSAGKPTKSGKPEKSAKTKEPVKAEKPPQPESELIAYAVFIRTKQMTRIHKVCTVDKYRRLGVGKWMMEQLINELKKARAEVVDLWVDKDRIPARALYKALGFEEMEVAVDYYSKGRDGIRMELRLGS